MIQVDLRDNNRIIMLNSDGKVPIRARQGSPMFHNAMDLLACSVGTCIGNHILRCCHYESVTPSIFKSIYVTIDNFKVEVILEHASDTDEKFLNNVITRIKRCEVASMLKDGVNVKSIVSKEKLEELEKRPRQKCCGQ